MYESPLFLLYIFRKYANFLQIVLLNYTNSLPKPTIYRNIKEYI